MLTAAIVTIVQDDAAEIREPTIAANVTIVKDDASEVDDVTVNTEAFDRCASQKCATVTAAAAVTIVTDVVAHEPYIAIVRAGLFILQLCRALRESETRATVTAVASHNSRPPGPLDVELGRHDVRRPGHTQSRHAMHERAHAAHALATLLLERRQDATDPTGNVGASAKI